MNDKFEHFMDHIALGFMALLALPLLPIVGPLYLIGRLMHRVAPKLSAVLMGDLL